VGTDGVDALVVPEEQRSLGDLKVRRVDTSRHHVEERHGDFRKLGRLRQLQDLLQLVEE
jgi:hypothetical protein